MDISSWFQVGGASVGATASYGGETTDSTMGHLRRVLHIEGQQQRQEEHDRLFPTRSLKENKDWNRATTDAPTKDPVVVEEAADVTVELVEENPAVVEDTNTDDDRKDLNPPEQTEASTLEPTEDPTDPAAVQTTTPNDNAEELETRIDLVKLVPFDVKLMMLPTASEINSFALTDIVTEWMDESLAAEVKRMELELSHSAFDSVILEERSITRHTSASTLTSTAPSSSTETTTTLDARATGSNADNNDNRQRYLQEPQVISITIASYDGVTLWKHTTPSDLQVMTPALLEDLERQALLQDTRLLELLQASPAQGLGVNVQDVRAYINPNPSYVNPTATTTPDNMSNGVTNANLELIIVVAIVVACMAFAFLVFSLFWAWRFDAQRRDSAYRVDTSASPKVSAKKSPDGNTAGGTDNSEFGEESDPHRRHASPHSPHNDDDTTLYPPSEGGNLGGNYPESVVSEDISTSLSAYYRSGMGSRPFNYGMRPGALGKDFDDQASFSSMESYGYSLDGYAPSLGGNTWVNPPPNTAAKAEEVDGDEEEVDNDRQDK